MGSAENRLEALGIALPTRIPQGGGFTRCREVGEMLFVSGHGPKDNDGNLVFRGQVGGELTVEQGYEAARLTAIQLLRSVKDALGTLDRVNFIVKALGFVNSAPGFYDQPAVMHGFSDLMVEAFGEGGVHSRSAIGTSILPNNQPVEIEMIVAVHPQ
jgi:enamine deaminase RidA (YjgF/YER057c/UK114 family)